MTQPNSISHDAALVRELQSNPEFAQEYQRAADQEENVEARAIAYRHLAAARGETLA